MLEPDKAFGNADSGRPLQLQDIQIILAASPLAAKEASAAAVAPNPLAAGCFQLSNRQQTTFQGSQPLVTASAHHWSWSSAAASGVAADPASASAVASQQVPSTSSNKQDAPILDEEEAKGKVRKKTILKDSQAKSSAGAATSGSHTSSSTHQSGASSSSCEGGLVEMACIAVRPVESGQHLLPSLAATKQLGEPLCQLVMCVTLM